MALPTKQRGVALLVLALILIVGLGTFVYARLGKWREATTASRKINSEVLAQAKAALIGYVVKEVLDLGEDVPGRFPCPESPTVAGTTSPPCVMISTAFSPVNEAGASYRITID